MRQSTIAVSSIALVLTAGAAILSAAAAQDAPVSYRTDPGAAKPAEEVVTGRPAIELQPVKVGYSEAAPYARDPIHDISTRQSVIVEAGDTVYALARRFEVTPNAIISANELEAPYTLDIGQELTIPLIKAAAVSAPDPEPKPQTKVAKAPEAMARPASLTTVAPAPVDLQAGIADTPTDEAPERLDGLYTVRPGDTLYSLSRRFEIAVVDLAAANGLTAPYKLDVSQRIVIPGAITAYSAPEPTPEAAPVASAPAQTVTPTPAPAPVIERAAEPEPVLVSKNPNSRFAWPLRGKVVMEYGVTRDGVRNDGINIAAPVGAPIRASADGEVVYKGAELEGYGNLLLIRHEDGWVSAYAHTDHILVEKGDRVTQGQVVAKVGRTGVVDQPQLHFELRHELKPQDPIAALDGSHVRAAALTR